MSERTALRWVWAAAWAALLAGAAWTGGVWHRRPALRERLAHRQAELRELAAVQAEVAPLEAARALFEALPAAARPAPLAALADRTLPGHKPDGVRSLPAEAAAGWEARQEELSFRGAPLERLMAFAREAEAQRPPWRLRRCVVRAASGGGPAQAVLRFESLARGAGAAAPPAGPAGSPGPGPAPLSGAEPRGATNTP
jgi:hypothetical protein